MKHQSITSLPPAPAADRGHRMLEYTVMMSIRVLCLVSLLWVRGWWILIPAAGAVFLPYFAVVVANVTRARTSAPERPGSIVRMDGVPGAATWEQTDEEAPQSSPDEEAAQSSPDAGQGQGQRQQSGPTESEERSAPTHRGERAQTGTTDQGPQA